MMKIKNKLKMSLNGLIGAMLLSGLFFGSPLVAFGGSPIEAGTEEGWILIAEKGDVKAYAQIVTCGSDEQSMYLVKLVNISKDEDLIVEYSINVTNSPTGGARKGLLKIMRNSSVEGSCDDKQPMLTAYMVNTEDGYMPLEIIIQTVKTTDHEK